ncbi:MAG: ribosomal-protein-alanine N-acetyltransferase [Flavobacteriales bacterium]|jgi:ribosomal-protein-alanine N-acetyltransferase
MIIETQRLVLRKFKVTDASGLLALNSDPLVMKYTGDLPFKDIEDTKKFVEDYNHYNLHGYGRWSVILKSNKEFIGWCGLKKHDTGYTDLGFRFSQEHWNKGYATESAKACIEYGFTKLQLNEIIGRVAQDNIASIKVLEKLGMSFWKKDECQGIADAMYYRISI